MKAKALILCVILSTFVMLISCSKDKAQPDSVKDSSAITDSSTKSTVSAWDDSFQEDSINKLTYIYESEAEFKWVTEDTQLINECIEALKNIKVKNPTLKSAYDDAGDVLIFKTQGGDEYIVEFEYGRLVKSNFNYEIEGFSELQKVFDKIRSAVKDSSAITDSSTKSTVSAWDNSFQEDSINKLTYIYEGEVGLKWVTDDPQLIHECIDAVKNIKVKKTTQMYAFDAGDRLEFKTKNGEKYTVEFTMGLLVKEQSNYEIEGFSELQKVLDKIKSEGKSVV